MKTFDQLHILEITGSSAGAFAAKLFADYGAQVTKLEPPNGDPARAKQVAGTGVSPVFAYLNTGKRSRALDLETEAGRGELDRWLGWADVVIESSAPDPLEPRSGAPHRPELIAVRISPFGSSGPYADYRSNEFTDDAVGGYTILNGEPDREPLARPGHIPLYQAGVHGFIGAMAALRARERTGRGQIVEVSHLEGLASMHQHTVTMWTHAGHILAREGNRQPGFYHPVGIYPCKDGYVQLSLPVHAMRDRFLAAADLPELLLDPRFADDLAVGQHKDEFDEAILPWLRRNTEADVVRTGQSAASPVGPVPATLRVLKDPHLAAREFWRTLGSPPLRHPRGPFLISDRARALRPAPDLGSANDGDPPPDPGASDRESARSRVEPGAKPSAGPLEGLRVLDLTRVWVGPFAARMLGDLGADVILVEAPSARGGREVPAMVAEVTHLFPDNSVGEHPWNRFGAFNKLARNRRGVTLNLKRPEAKQAFEALVEQADLVIENFTPRVMPKLGLDFDRLRAINPRLTYLAISGYGTTGPHSSWAAFGPILEAGTGFSHSMGYRDSGPYRSGVAWSDPVTGLLAVAGTLIALHDRDSDPERRGRFVETPMLEANIAFMGERLLEAQLRGEDPARLGSRHPRRAPQGCYPCAGENHWIAISVTNDAEWRALCERAGLGAELAGLDVKARRERHDEIDAAISGWTRGARPVDRMRELQEAGVIAAALSDARALCEDPHLAARGYWADIDHPEAGRHKEPGCAIRLSETPATYRRPAPCLGQHNTEVMREVAGLSNSEIKALEALGVLVDTPPA